MTQEISTLLVDDQPFARDSLRIFLAEHEGFRIIDECSNGLQAIQLINQHKPDLIFLDVQMPEVNGFEVLIGITGGFQQAMELLLRALIWLAWQPAYGRDFRSSVI